jgi:hypothetical protein
MDNWICIGGVPFYRTAPMITTDKLAAFFFYYSVKKRSPILLR